MRPTMPTKALISIMFLLILPTLAIGHGGRTDKSGGHHNRKNGTYHFHSRSIRIRHHSGNGTRSGNYASRLSALTQKKAIKRPVPLVMPQKTFISLHKKTNRQETISGEQNSIPYKR